MDLGENTSNVFKFTVLFRNGYAYTDMKNNSFIKFLCLNVQLLVSKP